MLCLSLLRIVDWTITYVLSFSFLSDVINGTSANLIDSCVVSFNVTHEGVIAMYLHSFAPILLLAGSTI